MNVNSLSLFSAVRLRCTAGLFLLRHVLQICKKRKNIVEESIFCMQMWQNIYKCRLKSVWESLKYKHSRLVYRNEALSRFHESFWLHKPRGVKHFFLYKRTETGNDVVSGHVWMCKSMIFETSEGKWHVQLVTDNSNCSHTAIVWHQKSWKVHRSLNMDYCTALFCLVWNSITLQFHQE